MNIDDDNEVLHKILPMSRNGFGFSIVFWMSIDLPMILKNTQI
jgi:hypothetical protein